MATPILTVVSWVLALFVSAFGLLSLGRGTWHLWRQISAGHSEPGRFAHFGRRVRSLVTTVLTHREFRSRPWVRAAHWLVMVSFVLLFLTLVSAYAHLRDQLWQLPLIGRFPLWEWMVEALAWAGSAAMVLLMVVRARAGYGSVEEAALSASGKGEGGTAGSFTSPRGGRADAPASRFLGSTKWQALFVEWVVLLVCVCVVLLRGLDHALTASLLAHEDAATWWHFPLTGWIGTLLGPSGLALSVTTLANAIVVLSLFKICVSMVWMMVVGAQTSMGIAWHRFTAFLNLLTRRSPDGRKSLGPAAPMLVEGRIVTSPEVFDDLPEDAVLGAGSTADLSWKDRLDLYSCTECGRCQELCPAWNTRKPLSPKLLIMSMRDHVESASRLEITQREVTDGEVPGGLDHLEEIESEGRMLLEKGAEPSPHSFDLVQALSAAGATGETGVAPVAGPLVPDVVSEEVLWDCTMCGACVDQCPVDIEHIDHILDLRRHRVLMEAAFPRELGRAFRGMESKANPYNQPARKRMDWAKGLDFDVPVVGVDVESADQVDYLFWVGCAGAFDDKAKATSAAVAELLHTAGVSFAVLGSGESCTGDPARRAGNEPLFQMLAAQAISALEEARAQRIVVSCAHCFNTIAGEYPELNGHFEVVHHTQLLNRLVREGKLRPVAAPEEQRRTVTYHDACYLGRHNRVYEPPRELVSALPGVDLVEMPRNHERAMCCGAGGAHAWFEETRGIRIADARMVEAAQTGADVVATACPFCSQMLGSATGSSAGFASTAASEEGGAAGGASVRMPEVRDVAVMLLESVRRGQGGPSEADKGGAPADR
ncbi:(Fe-S)-binding protein [Schaalia sp. 19OD2882]|uniref:(Fe-S)-binding protein n=1 Tax=Schaalia sp. 19OD2882 TaxID=2794089 RepID=UPI001C1F0009|nr:(Fe-S)-binding protein [Schaalia sp. 19OD2882]QWW19762.1 (Fe-S)-binding protein [Schaalia sp. 19OD2882]